MNIRTRILAVVFGALSATLLAQQSTQSTETTTTTTTTRNVTGSVVQYSPGQTIVLRSADGKTTTYTIGSAVTVPQDVEVGRSVTITTQPASDGSGPAMVTRIVTTSVGADGTRTTTERTESVPSSQSDQSAQTTETTTTVTGKVTAFQPRQSITIEQPGKAAVTYVIDPESQLPQDVVVGKTVTVTTRVVKGSPIVRTVTTKTVTTETKPQ
jgi:hypothetical protein